MVFGTETFGFSTADRLQTLMRKASERKNQKSWLWLLPRPRSGLNFQELIVVNCSDNSGFTQSVSRICVLIFKACVFSPSVVSSVLFLV